MLKQVGSAARWTYASIALTTVLQLATTAATARLLDPASFGLIAMANAVLHLMSHGARLGVGKALVQAREIHDEDVRAAFVTSVTIGALSTTAVVLAAPLIGAYYRSDDVPAVIAWLGLGFLISGFGATAHALLQRQLRFRSLAAVEVVSFGLGFALPAVALAALGFGVWSLVVGALGQKTIATALEYALTRHRVAPHFVRNAYARLLAFGSAVSAISVLEAIAMAADALLLGRFGTAAQLGNYNRGHYVAYLPIYRLNLGLAKVMLPILSRARNEPAMMVSGLGEVTVLVARLIVPVGVGMALASHELVNVLLGPQWTEAVSIVPFLVVGFTFGALGVFPGTALEAVGALRPKLVLQVAFVIVLYTALAMCVRITGDVNLPIIAGVIGVTHSIRAVAFYAIAVKIGVFSLAAAKRLVGTIATAAAATSVIIGVPLQAMRAVSDHAALALLSAVGFGVIALILLNRKELIDGLRRARAGNM